MVATCFVFTETATTDIYTLSLHDALPIFHDQLLTPYGLRSLAPNHPDYQPQYFGDLRARDLAYHQGTVWPRSEEHTSELQSRGHLVCRLLLEKKKWTTSSGLGTLSRCSMV